MVRYEMFIVEYVMKVILVRVAMDIHTMSLQGYCYDV